MKVMFGVTTYNRKDIIDYTSKSLLDIKGINKNDIFVFDDYSNEYDDNYLSKIYETNNIIKFKNHLGADKILEEVFKYFIESDYDYYFNCDSDLIFDRNIIDVINGIINDKKNHFIVSLFNTKNHKVIGDECKYYIKKNVGAAGILISKDLVKYFINKLPKKYGEKFSAIDYAFCQIVSNKVNIYSTKKSYVQHIGIHGQNSNMLRFDFGNDFDINSLINAKAIIYIYERSIELNKGDFEDLYISGVKNKKIGISLVLRSLIIAIKNKLVSIIKNDKRIK